MFICRKNELPIWLKASEILNYANISVLGKGPATKSDEFSEKIMLQISYDRYGGIYARR